LKIARVLLINTNVVFFDVIRSVNIVFFLNADFV